MTGWVFSSDWIDRIRCEGVGNIPWLSDIIKRRQSTTMKIHLFVLLAVLATAVPARAQSAPDTIDTSKLGPQVGATMPAFAGVDQFGKSHTLASIAGPKGAMVVFFRSADW
ncbi:MAG: hypothetical protein ABI024_00820 [Vicinamibacterales bacterium]